MSLPEHLKKKRDEIAERLANDMVGKIVIKQDAIEHGLIKKGARVGFDAACAELLPIFEKLEKALEFYSDYQDFKEIPRHGEHARKTIAELKKWRES